MQRLDPLDGLHRRPNPLRTVQLGIFRRPQRLPRIFDVSPLIKYRIQGRDAARFVEHLVTRDMTKVKPMQAAYTAWCDDDGKMVEEGTMFRLAENDFILNAALHQLPG